MANRNLLTETFNEWKSRPHPAASQRLRLCIASACASLAIFSTATSASDSTNGLKDVKSATLAPAAMSLTDDWHWRLIGPFRGGRTRAVSAVPGQLDTFYIGAVNGGVFKTTDAGRTWNPIFDQAPTQSIGAIAVARSDANRVYVASGEGLHRPDLSVGMGVFVSDDGGAHFESRGLTDSQQIAELAVDVANKDRVFAAVLGHPFGPNAERGVYRSLDAGRHWQAVLQVDEHTGANGVIIDAKNPNIVYATMWEARMGPWEDHNTFDGTHGGVYKSVDGGDHFKKIMQGLPDNASQINLTQAPSRPERLFAMVATTTPSEYSSSEGLELYRSDDGGEHWQVITKDPRPKLRIGGGDNAVIKVDPHNPDIVYATSIVTMKSQDGGVTWAPLRGAPGGDDYQNIYISPEDSNRIVLLGDQGALVSVNGGQTFSSWLNQPTAQLYHVGITPTFPYRVCSGQQESGSVCISSRGNDGQITAKDWHPVGVIEYGYVAPDPVNTDIVYGAGRTEVSRTHLSTGVVENVTPIGSKSMGIRTDRTEPLMFSPTDPKTLYFGASQLFKTTDGGQHWQVISPDLARATPEVPASVGERYPKGADKQRGVIYALSVSAIQPGLLVIGTDDGVVYKTTDEGQHWQEITPPGLSAWSKVTQIDVSHFDVNVMYVSVSRLRVDDLKPYVYKTTDGGAHWTLITEGLDAPVNAVREDTQRPGLLYAATERNVFFSQDAGAHWQNLSLNLPHTSMRDVVVKDNDLILATHGRGFWILDDVSRFRQAMDAAHASLLKPAVAMRLPRSTWSDTPLAIDEPVGENPPAGAVLEYVLPKAAHSVSIEIKTQHGELIRRYSSTDAQSPSEEELNTQLIPRWWALVQKPLSTSVGVHRLVWDLKYPEATALAHGYPISAVKGLTPREPEGPMVLPGSYVVELTVDGVSQSQELVVKADPRESDVSGIVAQFPYWIALYQQLNEVSRAALKVKTLDQQLEVLDQTKGVPDSIHEQQERLEALIKPWMDSKSSEPSLSALSESASAVYALVGRGNQAPTAATLMALEEFHKKLNGRWGGWLKAQGQIDHEVMRLNRLLKARKLTELDPTRAPVRDVNAADED